MGRLTNGEKAALIGLIVGEVEHETHIGHTILAALTGAVVWYVDLWRTRRLYAVILTLGVFLAPTIYAQFFTYQTRDMSGSVAGLYKKIELVKVEGVNAASGFDRFAEEYQKHWNFEQVTLHIHNPTPARLTGISATCNGKTVLTPPDYETETKLYSGSRTVIGLNVLPGRDASIDLIDANDGLGHNMFSQPQYLKCEITSATWVEGDLYRAAHEMDAGGTAGVYDTLLVKVGSHPIRMGSMSYPIRVFGMVENTSKRTVRALGYVCNYYDVGFSSPYSVSKSVDGLDLKPGEKQVVDTTLETGFYQPRPNGTECHIDSVSYR